MEEAILSKTKRFFRKNDLMFRIVILLFLATGTVYAFIFGNTLLQIFTTLSVGVMVSSFLSNYIFNFFYGEGYKLTHVINEVLYLFLGIPIMLIAAGYIPLSIFILFFSPDNNDWLLPLLIAFMVSMQIASFVYIINKRSKNNERTIFQFIRYLFDFKARAEEQKKHREHTEKIDSFYDGMRKVKEKIDTKMEESVVHYEEYDWKRRKEIKTQKRTELICWNCKTTYKTETKICKNCNVPLKDDRKTQ
ncbi:MAG: hypothetical protein H7644_06770 [Candidatus Heimdallarchaeota archaeon]|nr:hypothetical protein [Candidatus Heimdallarchaeota archaeon]MCK5143451.1 hypothetical protein [Candidatus Heimdallarchaeota archaeon]